MSLVVWLPLTKDLRQQGLSNVTVTNNGATFNSAGKLGGCYAPNGLTLTNLGNLKVYPMTITFWCKTTNTGTPSWERIVLIDNTSNSQIHGVYVADAARLKYEYNPSVNASGVNPKEWHHYAFIINNGDSKVYVDGILNSSSSETVTADIIGRLRIGTTSTIQLNDFRIYDHCLSSMEVKELAKGLVLHYPLNRNGWGQENLLLNSNDLTLWPIESSGQIELQEDGYFKVSSKASNTIRYGIYYDFTFPEPDTYTFSVDVRDDWLIGVAPASTFTWTTANLSGTQGKKRISYTCTSTEENNKCRIYIAGTGTGGRVTYLKQPKFEKGSIATPWCPNSADTLATTMGLNGTIEYDCSGFCNNGTRTGTFTWTSNTPKYAVSQYFNGSNYILTDSGTFSWFSFDKCTIAAWFKPTTTPGNYTGTIGISHDRDAGHKSFCIGNYGGKFTVCTADGSNYVNTQSVVLPINEWHHCVATLDDTTVKMYVDGELVKTYTLNWGSTALASDTRFQVGIDLPGSNEIYTGYYSDVRVYATALSADDVKSLYQNCATIDPDGTIRGQIRS